MNSGSLDAGTQCNELQKMKPVLVLVFASVILGLKKPVPFSTKPFDFCYEPLNPVETARATKMITDMFLSCKQEIFNLNIKPGVIRESSALCISFRFCYSLAEERTNNTAAMAQYAFKCFQKFGDAALTVKSDWVEKYNFNNTAVLTAWNRCGGKHMLRDIRFLLFGLRWLLDFM
ncbi:uncharacterized protein LOC144167328 [Haemaphysalis longicornis]